MKMTDMRGVPSGEAARGAFTIRERRRVQASPPPNHRQEWYEWQVVWGRRVVSRHDIRKQADDWVTNRIAQKEVKS